MGKKTEGVRFKVHDKKLRLRTFVRITIADQYFDHALRMHKKCRLSLSVISEALVANYIKP